MQTRWGQNWLAHRVTAKLSKDLQNRISIKNVDFVLFNKMNLEGVLVEDQQRDTLLYAGVVQVRITDWFFFKDKAELEYIGLSDAVIKLQRTDSVWNYAFLEDYFSSGGTTDKKKEAGIEFNLKQVFIRNVAFLQRDAWVGSNMIVKLGSLDLNAKDISISRKLVNISSLNLVRPFFHLHNYAGNRPPVIVLPDTTIVADTLPQWNPQGWTVLFNQVKIEDGTFKNDNGNAVPVAGMFDGAHIEFGKIDAQIKNFRWDVDTLRANVALAAQERSGLQVQSLKAALRFNPQLMEFENLYLKTNRSALGNYFAMKFPNFGSLNDFIHAVRMEANFENTSVASDDIAFFAPDIKNWNRTFQINGNVKGSVDALTGENMHIQAGGNTSLRGNVSLIGLPNINETFINVEADELRASYSDAVTFAPSIRRITLPNLSRLSYVRFQGTYTGFLNDFVTYGTIQTALGTLVTDLNMKLPPGRDPIYSGSVSTNSFQMGRFINNPQFGNVAFSGDVRGNSFDWRKIDLTVDGNIQSIQFNNYNYRNITAKGRLKNRLFDGNVVSKDPNADLQLNGLINLSGATPVFDVKANVSRLDLKALGFTSDAFTVSGDLDLNFYGRSIADFLGSTRIYNATLMQGNKRLSFDSLYVSSGFVNGVRTFTTRSNEFNAIITGSFDLESLPDAFTHFLRRYYPAYIKHPNHAIKPQSFTFNITTGNVDDYIKLLDNRLSGLNNSHITGALDMATNTLKLDADIPQLSFNRQEFSNIKLKADGNYERLVFTGEVYNAIISDSLFFPQTNFSIQAQNDVSDITLNTSANQTINRADLSARIKTFSNGFSVLFNPSSFILNGKTWNIQQGGDLDFRNKTILQGQLVLKESDQEIRISTQPSGEGTWNDLHIALQNIRLGDFSALLLKQNRMEGILNGEVRVEDPQNRLNIYSDFSTEQLRFDEDSIGQLKAAIAYNNRTGALTGSGNNEDPDHRINFELDLDLKDSANTHKDRITVVPVNYPIKILDRFIGTLFSDLQGTLTGQLNIVGEGANRDFIGKARINNAGMKVLFTQVFYTIDDTEIELTENAIKFGTLKLRDRFGNTATVNGQINHKSFQDVNYNIDARVDNRPMELLNTTYNDNQTFYGRAMGTGSLSLYGPQNDMHMAINARASETDSSYITLPPSRSRESGTAAFMVERKYGREMNEQDLRGMATNLHYDINLTANPLVNVEVILDELTGDVIRGRGRGTLEIEAGTSEPLTIRGRYDIHEGNYLFTFQSFFKKPFVLRPNSNNYIEWTGDPYAANIHFDAVYRAEDVSFAPLATSLLDQRYTRYRGDVNVIALLTGELFKPTINFQLEFPNTNSIYNDPSLAFGIQQIEKNPNEINKQVTYLIVFNSFAPYENAQNAGVNPFYEFAYSTLSGMFFEVINRQLNQVLSRIFRNNDLTFNFTGSLYNRNLIDQSRRGFNINQSNLNVSVGMPVFNDRFLITLGSTFDIPLESNITQNIQFLPDVTAQWFINKSGTIRATFFYRENLDFLTGQTTTTTTASRTKRYGANVAYRKEFDSLSEIFLGRKKGKLKKEATAAPADTTVSQK